MRQILRIWSLRNLSLLGRINIVKTLGISLLTYHMMNLEMPDYGLKAIEKILYEFIWGGKGKAKVKRSTLMAPIEQGGLKARDIYSQNNSWKIKWISKLCQPAKWNAITRAELNKVGGIEYLMDCNYDVEKLKLNITDFWIEVLLAFQNLNSSKKVIGMKAIKAQIINNNQNILIGGKSIYMNKLQEAQIDRVEDWLTWQNKIVSFDTLKRKCPRLNWLEYLQVRSAIPKEWIKAIEEEQEGEVQSKIWWDQKEVKKCLNQTRISRPTAIETWSKEKQNNISQYIEWKKQYKELKKLYIEPKLKSFQYLIMNKRITTKKERVRYGITDESRCQMCKQEETFEHIFLECPETLRLWEKLKNKLKQEYEIDYTFNKENIIFLQTDYDRRENVIINSYMIWAKQYRYRISIDNSVANFEVLNKEIECRKKMQKIRILSLRY